MLFTSSNNVLKTFEIQWTEISKNTYLISHCSHLDIYISQKTGSVCSEFVRPISSEPRGQTYEYFDLKIQIYYTHFFSIFCKSCQIQCFLHTVAATQIFQPFWNSIDSVQKALDLTIPAKNRRKMSIIDLNFQIKKLIGLASRLVWNWPYKFTTHTACFLWNVNVQMATVCVATQVLKGYQNQLFKISFDTFDSFLTGLTL